MKAVIAAQHEEAIARLRRWIALPSTAAPVSLLAGHFGLGRGGRQCAPDEYLVIKPENPKLRGFDGATLADVEILYALARA